MKTSTLLSCVLLALSCNAYAQPGVPDSTFSLDGKVITAIGNADEYGRSVAIQADGKIVVAGYSDTGSGYDFVLIRYNDDGTLDNTFGTGGMVLTDFGSSTDQAFSVTIQPDGKIVVAGKGDDFFTDIPANYEIALARYNTDGTLDNTFGTAGKVLTDVGSSASDHGYSVAIQTDGKIVVAGSSDNGSSVDFALLRYNSDGSLDLTFDADGIVTADFGGYDIGYSVAIQSDGKIVVAGSSSIGPNNYDFALARYNSDGSPDNTFDSDGMLLTDLGSQYDMARSVALQADNKIVAAGSMDNGSGNDFALVRYNTDGTLDNTFDSDGIATTLIGGSSTGTSLAIQSDGKIVVAGYSFNTGSSADFALARYNSDATLDNTFNTNGTVITDFGGTTDGDYGNAVAIAADGKIVVAGERGYNASSTSFIWDVAVARYNGDVTTGMDAAAYTGSLEIYPNPSRGIFTVKLYDNAAKMCIYNTLGKCILDNISLDKANRGIDLSSQAKGIYFMEIKSGGQSIFRKVVVE